MTKNGRERRNIVAWLALAAGVGALAWLGPWLAAPKAPGCRPGVATMRVVSWNVWAHNRDPAAAARWLIATEADVLMLVEVQQGSAGLPALLARAYPHQVDCHRRIPCSTMILARRAPGSSSPLGHGDVQNRRGLSALRVTPVDGPALVAVHLSRPWPAGRQERELGALLRTMGDAPNLVAGDFNMTLHGPLLWHFVDRADLSVATPAGPSWPARLGRFPALPLIGIDQLLVSPGWGVRSRHGPPTGSDHRPIIADICRLESATSSRQRGPA